MHYSKFSLLAAAVFASAGSSLLTAQTPSPVEFEYLLTEAPVTIIYSLTTGKRSAATNVSSPSGGTSVSTTADTFSVSAFQVLKSLQLQGQIPPAPAITTAAAGWEIVAVRAPASDIAFVDARHDFYAINRTANIRQLISPAALNLVRKYSTYSYVEQSIGAYTLNGKGSTTNYVELNHNLQFVRTGTTVTYQIGSLLSWGNASLTFTNIDEPIFYFPINLLRFTSVGEFSGMTVSPSAEVRGLATITFQIGTPKLVYASLYPSTAVDNVQIPNPFVGFGP